MRTGSGSLIVVRHAQPIVDPERSPIEWDLAPEGVAAARLLAASIPPTRDVLVIASPEPKAMATAQEIATLRNVPVVTDVRLREQGVEEIPFLEERAFRSAVMRHFQQPEEPIFGGESAEQAASRFAGAVAHAIAQARGERVPILVSHGRILSSWLTRVGQPLRPAEEIWLSLRMPDAFLVDLEVGAVERIELGDAIVEGE